MLRDHIWGLLSALVMMFNASMWGCPGPIELAKVVGGGAHGYEQSGRGPDPTPTVTPTFTNQVAGDQGAEYVPTQSPGSSLDDNLFDGV